MASGRVSWLESAESLPAAWWQERQLLLAIGSNRRPHRLLDHLSSLPDVSCAGLKIALRGADVVYPSHVSGYGVCTSTIVPCPGAVIESWLLLVREDQLASLVEREGAHGFGLYRLGGVVAEIEGSARRIESPLAFAHTHGPLTFADDRPRGLARVKACAGPIARVPLAAAHRRIEALLGKRLQWPLAAPKDVDHRLASLGLPIEWLENQRLSAGTRRVTR
jgi:hypothetical protein